jgi:ribosomal protein S18 acetylase RimI-like enzyme
LEEGAGNKMIKKISSKFVREVMELHKKAIFPLWDNLNRKYSEEGVKDFILGVFEKGEVYGYFDGKKILGVIGVEINEHSSEVVFLIVNPTYQSKGIGKNLMKFVEEKAPKKVILDVLIKNPAVGFYKKIGYKILKERNDKYFMEKVLK